MADPTPEEDAVEEEEGPWARTLHPHVAKILEEDAHERQLARGEAEKEWGGAVDWAKEAYGASDEEVGTFRKPGPLWARVVEDVWRGDAPDNPLFEVEYPGSRREGIPEKRRMSWDAFYAINTFAKKLKPSGYTDPKDLQSRFPESWHILKTEQDKALKELAEQKGDTAVFTSTPREGITSVAVYAPSKGGVNWEDLEGVHEYYAAKVPDVTDHKAMRKATEDLAAFYANIKALPLPLQEEARLRAAGGNLVLKERALRQGEYAQSVLSDEDERLPASRYIMPLLDDKGNAIDLEVLRVAASYRTIVDALEAGEALTDIESYRSTNSYVDDLKRDLLRDRRLLVYDSNPAETLDNYLLREGIFRFVPEVTEDTSRVIPFSVAFPGDDSNKRIVAAVSAQMLPPLLTSGSLEMGSTEVAAREQELLADVFGKNGVTSTGDYAIAIGIFESYAPAWALATEEVAQKYDGDITGRFFEIKARADRLYGGPEAAIYKAHHSDAFGKEFATVGLAAAGPLRFVNWLTESTGIHDDAWVKASRENSETGFQLAGALALLSMSMFDIDSLLVAAKLGGKIIPRVMSLLDIRKLKQMGRAATRVKVRGKKGSEAIHDLLSDAERLRDVEEVPSIAVPTPSKPTAETVKPAKKTTTEKPGETELLEGVGELVSAAKEDTSGVLGSVLFSSLRIASAETSRGLEAITDTPRKVFNQVRFEQGQLVEKFRAAKGQVEKAVTRAVTRIKEVTQQAPSEAGSLGWRTTRLVKAAEKYQQKVDEAFTAFGQASQELFNVAVFEPILAKRLKTLKLIDETLTWAATVVPDEFVTKAEEDFRAIILAVKEKGRGPRVSKELRAFLAAALNHTNPSENLIQSLRTHVREAIKRGEDPTTVEAQLLEAFQDFKHAWRERAAKAGKDAGPIKEYQAVVRKQIETTELLLAIQRPRIVTLFEKATAAKEAVQAAVRVDAAKVGKVLDEVLQAASATKSRKKVETRAKEFGEAVEKAGETAKGTAKKAMQPVRTAAEKARHLRMKRGIAEEATASRNQFLVTFLRAFYLQVRLLEAIRAMSHADVRTLDETLRALSAGELGSRKLSDALREGHLRERLGSVWDALAKNFVTTQTRLLPGRQGTGDILSEALENFAESSFLFADGGSAAALYRAGLTPQQNATFWSRLKRTAAVNFWKARHTLHQFKQQLGSTGLTDIEANRLAEEFSLRVRNQHEMIDRDMAEMDKAITYHFSTEDAPRIIIRARNNYLTGNIKGFEDPELAQVFTITDAGIVVNRIAAPVPAGRAVGAAARTAAGVGDLGVLGAKGTQLRGLLRFSSYLDQYIEFLLDQAAIWPAHILEAAKTNAKISDQLPEELRALVSSMISDSTTDAKIKVNRAVGNLLFNLQERGAELRTLDSPGEKLEWLRKLARESVDQSARTFEGSEKAARLFQRSIMTGAVDARQLDWLAGQLGNYTLQDAQAASMILARGRLVNSTLTDIFALSSRDIVPEVGGDVLLRKDVQERMKYLQGTTWRRTGQTKRSPAGEDLGREEVVQEIGQRVVQDVFVAKKKPGRKKKKADKAPRQTVEDAPTRTVRDTRFEKWDRKYRIKRIWSESTGKKAIINEVSPDNTLGIDEVVDLDELMVPPPAIRLTQGMDLIAAYGIKDAAARVELQANSEALRELGLRFVVYGVRDSDGVLRMLPVPDGLRSEASRLIQSSMRQFDEAMNKSFQTGKTVSALRMTYRGWRKAVGALSYMFLFSLPLFGTRRVGYVTTALTDDLLSASQMNGPLKSLGPAMEGLGAGMREAFSFPVLGPLKGVLPGPITEAARNTPLVNKVPNFVDAILGSSLQEVLRNPEKIIPELGITNEEFLLQAFEDRIMDNFAASYRADALSMWSRHNQPIRAYTFYKDMMVDILPRIASEAATAQRFGTYKNLRVKDKVARTAARDATHSGLLDFGRPIPPIATMVLGPIALFIQARYEALRQVTIAAYADMVMPLDEFAEKFFRADTRFQRFRASTRFFNDVAPAITGQIALPTEFITPEEAKERALLELSTPYYLADDLTYIRPLTDIERDRLRLDTNGRVYDGFIQYLGKRGNQDEIDLVQSAMAAPYAYLLTSAVAQRHTRVDPRGLGILLADFMEDQTADWVDPVLEDTYSTLRGEEAIKRSELGPVARPDEVLFARILQATLPGELLEPAATPVKIQRRPGGEEEEGYRIKYPRGPLGYLTKNVGYKAFVRHRLHTGLPLGILTGDPSSGPAVQLSLHLMGEPELAEQYAEGPAIFVETALKEDPTWFSSRVPIMLSVLNDADGAFRGKYITFEGAGFKEQGSGGILKAVEDAEVLKLRQIEGKLRPLKRTTREEASEEAVPAP